MKINVFNEKFSSNLSCTIKCLGFLRIMNHKKITSLGVFNKKLMPPEPWFDENFVKISEDSDLNFRIRKNGGLVYLCSDIKVDHYPRENLNKFYTLCYNYGFGRGLFYYKHKTFSALRLLRSLTSIALKFSLSILTL